MPDPSAPPGTAPAGPSLQQLDEVLKPKSISPAAENYRLHIEWRKLRNRAQNDPAVKAAFTDAEHARTDLEKRHLLAHYFDVLFDKEIALAPQMKDYLNDRRREHLNGLPQPRVRPTPAAKNASKEHGSDHAIHTQSLATTPTPAAVATPSPPPGVYPTPPEDIH